MNLGRMFHRSALKAPDAMAFVDGDIRRTYADWEAEFKSVAGGLLGLGLKQGDFLVVSMANRYEMATLHWACQYAGIVCVPFNWRASAEEIAYVLNDTQAAVFAHDDCALGAPEAAETAGLPAAQRIVVGGGEGTPFASLLEAAPLDGPGDFDDSAISLMLYTSGTTGRPKGVPRSHAAERTAATHCVAQLRYRFGESCLGVMPLFHTMGVRALLMEMLVCGNFVCMQTFDPADAVALIEAEGISALFLVPTMFHDMMASDAFDVGKVTSASNLAFAGQSMTSGQMQRCIDAFEPESFINYYGSSEIFTFSVCDHVADKPGCAGRPGINQALRVVTPDPDGGAGPEDQVAPGEVGEVVAPMAGLEAFAGYWNRPDADAKAIRDDWYFTGDLGYLDEDGELFLVGRVDDMVISGGENIHPEEVEDVLDKSPLVRRAAVIGEPDERMGQRVVAYIEPATDDVTARALDTVCRDSALANFKRPRRYVFVEEIPTSAAGKLLRRFLRDGDVVVLDTHDTEF